MVARVFARQTDKGLEFISTTFDATESDDVRPGFEETTKYTDTRWVPVVRVERPESAPGYSRVFDGWVITPDAVFESWSVVQRPQPYPSWSWVEGQGWQPPVPEPASSQFASWAWDEGARSWVEFAI